SRLQNLKVGDQILVGRKPTGTLILDNLLPGKNLYMLSTGTGLAPFLSLIKDPEVYERFDKVILTHTCRKVDELAYAEIITQDLPANAFFGDAVREK
ncbi:ferredoxin--NADP reductase, partial [Acinetobacter baumannii]